MAHRGRLSKSITHGIITPDSDAVSGQQWLNMVGAVNKCGAEMELLWSKYGDLVFGVNISVFYENLPGRVMAQVERLRYHNTRLQNPGGAVGKYFKM